jgi:alkylation response protein AidB-like acyl-CoA dehydrogenase
MAGLDLDLDPVQTALQETVRGALERAQRPAPSETRAWRELAALGAPGFELPAVAGGLNLGLGATVVLCEELGRACCPSPLLEALFAADLIAAAGPEAGPWRILPRVAEGSLRLAVVGLEAPGCRAELSLRREGDRWRLGGRSEARADLRQADRLVVMLPPRAGGEMACLPATRAGCRVELLETLADGPLCRCLFSDVVLEPDDILVPGSAGPLLPAPLARARIRQAAFLWGLAELAAELARERARTRRQFGQPLIQLQTVGARLAALHARLEATRLLVHRAAWSWDRGEPVAGLAPAALAMAAELALDASRLAMQLHGASGMLRPGPTERLYRHAAVEALRYGRIGDLWSEAGTAQLATVPEE